MITQLSTVKARLAIDPLDTTYDALLTNAIKAVSTRFDRECNRTLARTVGLIDEFDPRDTELPVSCYPVESVTKFETKSNETDGWVEQNRHQLPDPWSMRRLPLLSLTSNSYLLSPARLARVTYTGGYVLPGTTPDPGKTGLTRSWQHDGTYEAFLQSDLLSKSGQSSKSTNAMSSIDSVLRSLCYLL